MSAVLTAGKVRSRRFRPRSARVSAREAYGARMESGPERYGKMGFAKDSYARVASWVVD